MASKILLIEDDDDDFVLFEAALSKHSKLFELTWAKSFGEGIQLMQDSAFDVCIFDYYLGAHTGLDAIREAIKLGFSGPLIMLTGARYSEKIDEEALSNGADDYISKSEITPSLLKRTLMFNIQRKETEHRYRTSEARYRQLAEISSSTLHNIGNVLNSLTVSSQLMDELLSKIDPSRLGKAAKLLEESKLLKEDSKARLIPEYLRRVRDSINDGAITIRKSVKTSLVRLKIAEQAIGVQQNTMRGKKEETYCVVDLLNEAFTLHRSTIYRKQIECLISGDENLQINFDRPALLHIFINLIKNAMDALYEAPEKKINVTLEVRDQVIIRISDTGLGMTENVLKNLFAHGFTTKTRGNGFGLHFCRQVLKQAGGSITAESSGPGKGSSFTITISKTYIQRDENG